MSENRKAMVDKVANLLHDLTDEQAERVMSRMTDFAAGAVVGEKLNTKEDK